MNGVRKALVLAGGKGARLRPLTHAMAKQLAPVANKPILFYALDSLWQAGLRDVGIIISPETGAAIREAVARWQAQQPQPCAVTFIPQAEPAGLAHAVAIARPYLGDEAFIMYLGDNLINGDLRGLMDDFEASPLQAASILLTPVENPSAFGVAVLDAAGGVARLVEKPAQPPSNLALVGVYLFRRAIFEAIEQIQPSARGELEITDAIQRLIDDGRGVLSRIHEGWWLDTGKKDDLLAANRRILCELPPQAPAPDIACDADSRLTGAIHLGAHTRLTRCRIEGPVVIGADCVLEDAVIGPHASIGDGATLRQCRVRNSVILNHCVIEQVMPVIADSLMGHACRIGPLGGLPDTVLRVLLADDSILSGGALG